jgi:GTPase SAR1 family protein
MKPPVVGIAGWKNSGKTTLAARLVSELTERGYAVTAIKHARESFDIDQPGRDSYRLREAGARQKAGQVGNRTRMADRKVPVDRVVPAGRVVRGNRMSMQTLVDQVVLAGRAPIKRGPLVVLGKVASRPNARRTANTSRKVIRRCAASSCEPK